MVNSQMKDEPRQFIAGLLQFALVLNGYYLLKL